MMNYIMIFLIAMLLLKILELQKRVDQLAPHRQAHPNKSVLVRHSTLADLNAPRVYVIPDESPRPGAHSG